MILVTGANGHLGRTVVDHLAKSVGPDQVIAASRDPAKLSLPDGMEARRADFADPDSLAEAFAEVEQLLIVSVDKLGEEARNLHRNAIDAAREAGVGRVFYTSHAGARAGSPFLPADQHAATEAELADSGLAFTALRHGFYAESCLQMIGEDLRRGELRVPESGPVSWTARDDLAQADAAILSGAMSWEGASAPLTASRALTMAEIAETASDVTSREIRHTVIPDEQWRSAKVAAGVPERYADMLLGVFRASRDGDFDVVDPTLERLLGREPRTLRDFLATELSAPRATDHE